MKSLLALLSIGLILGLIYWKTEHPEAGVDEIAAGATGSIDRVKTGFNAFAEAGDTQASAKNEITDRLDSIEAELLESKSNMDPASTQSRIESLEASLVESQQSAADPAVVNGRLTDAERRMSATETKISEYKETSAQVAVIEGRLDQLNQRIEQQGQSSDSEGINSALAELDSKIDALQAAQQNSSEDHQLSIGELSDKIVAVESRLDGLASAAVGSSNANNDEQIASLSNDLLASQQKVQALEQSVASTNEQIVAMTQSMNDLQTQSQTSSIDGQQAQIQAQLTRLQNQVNQASDNTNVSQLSNALQSTRDRIKSLEQQVTDLPDSSAAANDASLAQSALEAQIIALEEKLANVQATPDEELANSISQVQEKVSELASKSYVTQEELREQQKAKSLEYRIYFDRNSTAINSEAEIVLDNFIAQESERTLGVAIYGFTDRRGSADYNQRLALQRATNVRSYLIQKGFSYTKIRSLSGLGEDAAAAVIADGAEDAQQRAVVLYAQQP